MPRRIVGVLNIEFWERRFFAVREGVVDGRQLLEKQNQRPAVADDVMHHHQKNVLLFVQPDERRTDERSLSQIKGRARFLV